MIVAGIQHDIIWERPAENFSRLAPMIERAAAAGARLVVLTEMYATGFSMKTDRIAEPIDGPSARFLVEQARAHDVWVCASVPERAQPSARPFNQLVLAAPEGSTRRYAKIHPFTFGREHEHYAAGKDFLTVDIEGARCTFFVCYDLRLLRARAIENQAYVVGVNRVGDGGRLHYCGDSMIIDPFGEIVAQASETETIITANVDPDRVRAIRAEYPFLQDRR
jgi:predicted amidohydrolase